MGDKPADKEDRDGADSGAPAARQTPARRDFLATGAGVAVWCCAGGVAFGGLRLAWPPFDDGRPRRFPIGRLVDFKPGTLTWLRDVELFVKRAEDGIGAFSSRCTHLGCSVQRSAEGFICPCHGARYDPNGRVTKGPARRALPWYRLEREPDARIWVDIDQLTPAGTLFSLADTEGPAERGSDEPAAGRAIGESDREYVTDRDPNTLLGGESGLDHVGVVVRELETAAGFYERALGFSNGQRGTLPNGLKNVNFYFGDTTYLELLTPVDKQRAPDVASFVDKYGNAPMFLVLCVYSVEETTAFLKTRGVKVGAAREGSIETEGMAARDRPLWYTLFFDPSPLAGDPLYFIAYDRRIRNFLLEQTSRRHIRKRAFSHANTAQGLGATWIAVRDVDAALEGYLNIGLERGREVSYPQLGARGIEVKAGGGSLLLLQPTGSSSQLEGVLTRRGECIVGVTITVESLAKAREVVGAGLGSAPTLYSGWHGQSFLVPPEQAFGVWLEMAQA